MKSIAKENGLDLVEIHGSSSLNNFVISMAYAVHAAAGTELLVWIDDCDGLFMGNEALNVMKGALDAERNVIAWGKNLTSQINNYLASESPMDNKRGEALRAFQTGGSPGVSIPTTNVRFIVTSNLALTAPSGNLNSERRMHEAAIRDRVNYIPFDLTDEQSWGWAAHVLLTNDLFDLTEIQKHELLNWMHTRWASLPSQSMRQVKDYAAAMQNDPVNYRADWEMSLLGVAA